MLDTLSLIPVQNIQLLKYLKLQNSKSGIPKT